jgi:hypothetical protein
VPRSPPSVHCGAHAAARGSLPPNPPLLAALVPGRATLTTISHLRFATLSQALLRGPALLDPLPLP